MFGARRVLVPRVRLPTKFSDTERGPGSNAGPFFCYWTRAIWPRISPPGLAAVWTLT